MPPNLPYENTVKYHTATNVFYYQIDHSGNPMQVTQEKYDEEFHASIVRDAIYDYILEGSKPGHRVYFGTVWNTKDQNIEAWTCTQETYFEDRVSDPQSVTLGYAVVYIEEEWS